MGMLIHRHYVEWEKTRAEEKPPAPAPQNDEVAKEQPVEQEKKTAGRPKRK